ncbi:SNF-related serine/threonine-protein kinase [Drosophila guanche]|uniref:SNF-related serine/threonine-protein kinase n=2 Tax=Drosophila guanche TaxID=7266 RepID=A0A3B0JUB4_DROGU|nr:SNF-related serine/threonine-protein kinase [Drosophila guanche]XP_034141554.1 SNF-related serine/threonine-protein kinase [Drosophila guanche]XP_034141555.1 SNF-related serine/threonine-protein kinase [Drosophila guanche]SPP74668.1 blast:SNF-related serine/threonine-protein kinase [Drosophila guanche]
MTLETQPVGGLGDGKIAGLYDLEETLGSGHFAVVKLARHVFTGAKVAVKVVDKTKLDEVSKTHLFQEVRCMKLVQHPNVVRLYEVIDTQTKLYLVLELGDGGDLYDYIMKHEAGLSEELARKYFRQILRAITYCHQLHVVHRDLKPENVVFFEKLGLVKLTDFGFSNKFSPGQKLETFCGSLAYSAPEILLGDSYDAPAVDIWSLGVILYMLVVGQAPFEKANDSETLTMIMDCKYTVPAHVSAECRTLIASMLVRDPKKRATVEELASSDWLKAIDEPDSTSTEHFLPLVSREQLSEEDHDFIIQKIINGNIASEEEIVQALDKNKYNHITATYFLVAEILLRRRREEQAQKQKAGNASRKPVGEKPSPTEAPKVVPISINVTPAAQLANDGGKPDKRSRKCSIVREEDEEESASEGSVVGNELKVTTSRLESTSEGQVNRAVQERTSNVLSTAPATVGVPRNSRTKIVVSVDATLAHKLKQMEKSAKIDEDTLRGLKELEIGKLKPLPSSSKNPVLSHRRTKLNKGTPSCSSSEASDDDTKTRNKKKINKFVGDTPTRFRMHRRDSHDDSSDSQDQLYPPPGSATGAENFISKSSGVSGKKEGQGQCKEPNKSEETRKSHTHTQQKNRKQPKDHVDKHSQAEKQQSVVMEGSTGTSSTRRRRMRESQSLDRITEAQEYELRHRSYADGEAASSSAQHIDQRYSQSILITSTFSVAETKEEYDEDEEPETKPRTVAAADPHDAKDQIMNTLNAAKATLQQEQYFNNNTNLSRNFNNNNNKNNSQSNSRSNKKKSNETPKDIYNLNSIEEIDLILEDKSLTKAIHVTGSKCFVTMKKIRRLGKYFPVVNFS